MTRRRITPGACLAALLATLSLAIARPGDAAAANEDQASQHGWRWHLTGIILGPGLREALFVSPSETRVLLEGEQLDGWTLTDVRARGVTLRNAGAEMHLGAAEWLPDDVRAAESVRREQHAQADRAAKAALDTQQQDQDTAATALTEATEQMMRPKPR